MPKTILIIEDDPDILDIMNYILSDEGHYIISATDGESLKNLQEIQPALILLDNRLTDGYGSNMCLVLKSDPTTAHFPVVLFSANTGLAEMAIACKADAYLSKPFNLDEFNGAGQAFCGLRSSAKAVGQLKGGSWYPGRKGIISMVK